MPSDLAYWLISAPLKYGGPQSMLDEVRGALPGAFVAEWDIPEFKTGTLSSLLTLSDALPKLDSAFTGTVSKLLDQLRTLVENNSSKVQQHARVNDRPAEEYVMGGGKGFKWDKGRWGEGSKVGDVLEMLTSEMNTIESTQKQKAQSYNLAKGSLTNLQRKQNGNLSQRSLLDVVKKEHLVDSEYLETLVVAVPKNLAKEWTEKYERLTSMVVPRSSQQIADDDEYVLRTVTVFKKVRDDYIHKCRENKFIVRDFHWDDSALEKSKKDLAELEVEEKELWTELLRLTRINFSEAYQILAHLKTIRLFVESVLRYGLPAAYSGVVIKPDTKTAAKTLRSLTSHYSHFASKRDKEKKGQGAGDDVGVYNPFWMEFQPLLAKINMPSPANVWEAYILNRYLVGVGLLLGVVVLWTASNFITAELETGGNAWNKPFLITYFNTASFTIYLLPTLWRKFKARPSSIHNHSRHAESIHSPSRPYLPLPTSPTYRRSASLPRSTSPHAQLLSLEPSSDLPSFEQNRPLLTPEEGVTVHFLPRLSVRETAEIAAWWSLVWFIANWAINASLSLASVASVTILSSTSGFFTLALGRICGVESLSSTKLFAVIASFLGVVLVTKSDSTTASSSFLPISDTPLDLPIPPSRPIFGDLLALTSAAFYAIYVVLLKVRIVDEERADMQLLLGFAGLFNTLFLIPVFPLLHYTGIEPFALPPTKAIWLICLINFCITLSSDYLYVLAMLKTTPTLVTVGLSLTIPLALLGEMFLPMERTNVTAWSIAGAGLVFVGFSMLGWQEYTKNRESGVVVVTENAVMPTEDEEQRQL
ncbi:uncharacterized protein L203_105943 [Cryptococcus depauperatus CBS 7841]|uniref:V-type proton ATPase subunit C n=1 Tax=Cryptococcus depauperatus CBS 7841 TaxID=1295531 RepID=A0AAJ8JYE3_9TREE